MENISVVIPTRNRPGPVVKAVCSVLDQTYRKLEVIVVIDGPDPLTEHALEQVKDPRVRTVRLPENVGPADARNIGVREAQGPWIAFLDDDDEWLPVKLEKQMSAAGRMSCKFPIVACYVIIQSLEGEFVQPKRTLRPNEAICEYLFSKPSFSIGVGLVFTSTLLVRKELLAVVPFSNELIWHEDWDLFLRASQIEGAVFEIVPEPLVIMDRSRTDSLSTDCTWSYSMNWLRDRRNLVTPRAYAGFVSTIVAHEASQQRAWKVFLPLLWEMCRFGSPRIIDFLQFLLMWLIPPKTRRKVRYACRNWEVV